MERDVKEANEKTDDLEGRYMTVAFGDASEGGAPEEEKMKGKGGGGREGGYVKAAQAGRGYEQAEADRRGEAGGRLEQERRRR